MSLQGQIEEMGLGAVIQTLSLNRYRGTLRIETEDAGSQLFFISEGEIVLIRQVKREPIRIGDILVRAGKITKDDLEDALEMQKQLNLRLGETLAELGKITQEEIEQSVRANFEDKFLDLFLIDAGRFEFVFGLTPEALFGPEEKLERITLNTSGLMMEAMRRLDEWHEILKSLGNFDTIFTQRMKSQGAGIADYALEGVNLPARAREQVYGLLDGNRSLREVIGTALRDKTASRKETFLFLHGLHQHELVKPLDFRTLLGEAKRSLGSGDVPGAAKYIRAILGGKDTIDLKLVERYLEFLKKHGRPRLAFDEARRFAAQALANDETDTAITLYEAAVTLDRNVEVIDRLFYALLRANQRDRAVQVGLMLRDFLSTEAGMQVAQRVARNIEEIAPDDPEVIEFAGLLLKRSERNEEAIAAFERALEPMPADHPRRRAVIEGILDMAPERNDLRALLISEEERLTQLQLQREVRRRWVFVGGTLLLVAGALWLYGEVQGRALMAQVKALEQQDFTNPQLRLRRLSSLVQAVPAWSTVSGEARELEAQVEDEWSRISTAESERLAREHAAQKELDRLQRDAAQREARVSAFRDALAIFRGAMGQGDYRVATAKALETVAAFRDATDADIVGGLPSLRAFAWVDAQPVQATVIVDGEPIGTTPLAVPIAPGAEVQARVTAPGYDPVILDLDGSRFTEHAVTLEPGPTWRVTLAAEPTAVAAGADLVVVGLPDGTLRALRRRDGALAWEKPLLEKQPGPILGLCAFGDTHLVAVRGAACAFIELRSGRTEWEKGVPVEGTLQPPAAGRVGSEELIVLVSDVGVALLDARTGTALKRFKLPAPAIQAPVLATKTILLALEDRLAALRPDAPAGKSFRWQRPGKCTLPVLFSQSTGAALMVEGSRVTSLAEEDGAVVAVLEAQVGHVRGVALARERLYVLGSNGFMGALRTIDGVELMPPRPVAKGYGGGPVSLENEVDVVDGEGNLLRLSLSGKRRSDPIPLGGVPTQPLRVAAGAIVCVIGPELALLEPAALR